MIPGVRLDPALAVPPSEQLRSQLAAEISDGRLVAGTRLPTVRALAGGLGLAVNTVAKCYRALETAGLIETRGRAGTSVSDGGDTARARIREAAGTYARLVRALGVEGDEGLAMVRAALADAAPG